MPDSLVLHGLTKRYGVGPPVIDSLDATFEPGTATGLVGPNGSGKTTLLRLLSALSFPTSGRATYGAIDIHREPYRYLGYTGIVQDSGDLPAYLTAVELLTAVLRARGRFDADGPVRVEASLDLVRLDERRHALLGTYSTGMRRKTELALAFALDPAVLLLDEPLRGLDAETRPIIVDELRRRAANGAVVLVASHFEDAVASMCDRILTLGQGRVQNGGTGDS